MRSNEWNPPASMIGRVSMILDCFNVEATTLSLSELSRRTGLAKSTLSRVLAELVTHGFLERQSDGFTLGLRFFELGEAAIRPRLLRRLAYSCMTELRHETGHTVHLAVLDGSDVVYIEILPSRTAPRMPSRVGGRVHAHATAVGKVLIAHADTAVRNAVLHKGLRPVGPKTITDPTTLEQVLNEVRISGVATERSESAAGVACVAALLPTPDAGPLAAISVSGSEEVIDIPAVTAVLQRTMEDVRRNIERLPHDLRKL